MDRRFYVALTALAVFSFGSAACEPIDMSWDYDDAYWSDYGYDDYYLYTPAMDVLPQGDLAGDFSNFDRSASVAEVTSYDGMVEVTTIDNQGSAMAQLNIYGDLGDIPAGESRTFHIEDEYAMWGGSSDMDVYVMGVGCANASTDSWGDTWWDVDETAEVVTVTVDESVALDGSVIRDYSFTATFPSYTDGGWEFDGYTTLSGSFQARKGGAKLSL